MSTDETAMSGRVRDPGHGLIVGFPGHDFEAVDTTLDTLKGYFFRVAETQSFYYEYDQLAAFEDGETRDFRYLGDGGHGTGEDILRVEIGDFRVYHVGYAPANPNLNVYRKVAPSSDSNKALSRRGGFDGPQPGDNFGYFSSTRAPDAQDPPASTELVAFRNGNDGEFHQFGFSADDDITDTTIHFAGRGYKLHPVTDHEVQNRMLEVAAGNGTPVGELPTVLTEVGGLGDYRIGTELPDQWGDDHARVLDYTGGNTAGNTSGRGNRQRNPQR